MTGAGDTVRPFSMGPVPAWCLDITRLISRQGMGVLTGVDRVELAYLRWFCAADAPLYLLARSRFGSILVAPDRARAVLQRLEGTDPWGKTDLLGALRRRLPPERRRAEADLRRFALARAPKGRLAQVLQQKLPPGTVYLNVGHSNLTDDTLRAWQSLPKARVVVLVHDTIPLDHPEFQRAESVDRFRAMLPRVAKAADRVIFSTEAARASAEPWFNAAGRLPTPIVAPLGVSLATPDPRALPQSLPPQAPYFVTVGTIEPRKNHALLLDIWDSFDPARAPRLVIAGRRGWENEQVFKRLDALDRANAPVLECPDLDDGALAALLENAAGALFPSLAEGYGLPPVEAAALGVPMICTDLPVTREIVGNIPVYLSPRDVYLWGNNIRNLAAADRAKPNPKPNAFQAPTWEDHFNLVLKGL